MADVYTRPYGDAVSSNFPKMGEHPLEGSIVNTSGNRSPYTHPRPEYAPTGGQDAASAGGRGVGPMATGENAGPRFAPVTTISYPNSPEASETGRALRTVRSAIGNRDFWDKRYASGEVIA